ncbi:MAG: hypothetical protein WBM02_01765 [bacterium]
MKITSFPGSEIQKGNNREQVETKDSRFSRVMNGIGLALAASAKIGGAVIPGASVISSFFEAFGQKNMMGEYGGMTPMEMLNLQQEMLQEARVYTLLSNLMRIRHDTAMNAIRNIK